MKFIKIFFVLIVLSTIVFLFRVKNELGKTETDLNEKSETSKRQVLNIPPYPNSIVNSQAQKNSVDIIAYIAPPGTKAEDIFEYYEKEMPKLGWTKKQEFNNEILGKKESVIYENSKGVLAELYFFAENIEKGAGYIISSPPSSGDSTGGI